MARLHRAVRIRGLLERISLLHDDLELALRVELDELLELADGPFGAQARDAELRGEGTEGDGADPPAIGDEFQRGTEGILGRYAVQRGAYTVRCGGPDAIGQTVPVGDGMAPSWCR